MDDKKGVLELLCGPSGVGKTSSLEGVKRSYRIIDEKSRPIRSGECVDLEGNIIEEEQIKEIILDKGIFESQFSIFVSAQEFDRRINEEFFVWYETEDKRRYGFGEELKQTLESGKECSEQITTFEGIELVESKFNKFCQIKKILFIAIYNDIISRVVARGGSPIEINIRIKATKENLIKLLKNRKTFDSIVCNLPYRLIGKEAKAKIEEILVELEKNKIPNELWDDLYGEICQIYSFDEDKNTIISKLKNYYLKMKNSQKTPQLVLNNFSFYPPMISYEFKKMNLIAYNSTDYNNSSFLVPFVILHLLFECGEIYEGLEEYASILYSMKQLRENDWDDVKDDYIVSNIKKFFVDREEDHKDGYTTRDSTRFLYKDLTNFNIYMMMEMHRIGRCIIDATEVSSDYTNIVKDYKFVKSQELILYREMIPFLFKDDREAIKVFSNFAQQLEDDRNSVSESILEIGDDIYDKRQVVYIIEYYLFDSLIRQNMLFPEILNKLIINIRHTKEFTDKQLCEMIIYPFVEFFAANNVSMTDDSTTANFYTRLSCVYIERFFREFAEIIYMIRVENDWDDRWFYPAPIINSEFLKKYWIDQLPSLKEIMEKARETMHFIYSTCGYKV